MAEGEGLKERIDLRRVREGAEKAPLDEVSVHPARVYKNLPAKVLNFLRITPEDPGIKWVYLEDKETGERVVCLVKAKKGEEGDDKP